jgi:hypothetical protein
MPDLAEHLRALRAYGCVVSGYRGFVTLHHCHGGSMLELGGTLRGVGQKSSDWLQIPLRADLHVGVCGIDVIGVEEWEGLFGRQLDYLDEIVRELQVDVFRMAGLSRQSSSDATK